MRLSYRDIIFVLRILPHPKKKLFYVKLHKIYQKIILILKRMTLYTYIYVDISGMGRWGKIIQHPHPIRFR